MKLQMGLTWGRQISLKHSSGKYKVGLTVIHELNQTVNDGVAHYKNPKKCAYHVTFDLDLEHTLDAGSPGDHPVQVWLRSGHLSARRSDLRKSLQTDGLVPVNSSHGQLVTAQILVMSCPCDELTVTS